MSANVAKTGGVGARCSLRKSPMEGNRLKGALPGGKGRGNSTSRSVRFAPVMVKSGGKIFHHPFSFVSSGTQVRLSSWRARSVIIIIEALPPKTRTHTHTHQLSPIRLQMGWMLHLELEQRGELGGFSRQKKNRKNDRELTAFKCGARFCRARKSMYRCQTWWSRKSKLQQRTNRVGRGERKSGTHWCLCKWRRQCFVSLTDILTFKHRL